MVMTFFIRFLENGKILLKDNTKNVTSILQDLEELNDYLKECKNGKEKEIIEEDDKNRKKNS